MKKTIMFFVILACIGSNVYSQTGWYQINTGISDSNYISSIFFSELNSGYLCGGDYNGVSHFAKKTTNQGVNWLDVSGFSASIIHKMFFLNNNTGFICGEGNGGSNSVGLVFRTTNGGVNWYTAIVSGTSELFGIQFINDSIGFAVGYYHTLTNDAKVIVKTTNRGSFWSPSISYWQTYDRFYDVHFPSNQTGYVVGENSLAKTTNTGDTWTLLSSLGGSLQTVYFVDNSTGFIGGNYWSNYNIGIIYKTTNGGMNWVTNINLDSTSINEIKFVNSNTGYAVTYYKNGLGSILKTTNAGTNWVVQKVTPSYLEDIYFVNGLTGYTCSGNGTIWKTTDGGGPIGIKTISNIVPDKYSLTQNYPNPFNPSTNIRYQIPNSKFVKLSVYDLLGKEIATLVNEKQSPGTYEVTFNGTNYPSGVYFYALAAGNFNETKKMLLVK